VAFNSPCFIEKDAISNMKKFFEDRAEYFEKHGAFVASHRPQSMICKRCASDRVKRKCDYPKALEFLHAEDPFFQREVKSEGKSKSVAFPSSFGETSATRTGDLDFKLLEQSMAIRLDALGGKMEVQNQLLRESIKAQHVTNQLLRELVEEMRSQEDD